METANNDLKFKLSHLTKAFDCLQRLSSFLKIVLDKALIQHKQQALLNVCAVCCAQFLSKKKSNFEMLECHNDYLDCLEHGYTT